MMTISHQEDPAQGPAEGMPFSSEDNVISFRDISNLLRQRRWTIIAVTLLFPIAATVLTLLADDKFQTSIVVSPASDESGGGRLGSLASLASQLGGLGSLGLSIPGSTQKAETV